MRQVLNIALIWGQLMPPRLPFPLQRKPYPLAFVSEIVIQLRYFHTADFANRNPFLRHEVRMYPVAWRSDPSTKGVRDRRVQAGVVAHAIAVIRRRRKIQRCLRYEAPNDRKSKQDLMLVRSFAGKDECLNTKTALCLRHSVA